MPAKPIAAMGRSYRCPQADRRDCLQLAARQRSVEDGGRTPTGHCCAPPSAPIHPPRPAVVNPIRLKLMQIKNPGQA